MAVSGARDRGLVVLADGVHAAFAAGAVAALAEGGPSWVRVLGAGLGGQVAVLAALGEAEDGVRRWRHEAKTGCPLLTPLAAAARVSAAPGMLILPDPWRMGGWLDPRALEEHLMPEAAALPARLARTGVRCAVPRIDLVSGHVAWLTLNGLEAEPAAEALLATATFAGGFPPREGRARVWGGVGGALMAGVHLDPVLSWDVVCGFPVPPTERPAMGQSLFELVQRRDEIAAGAMLADLASGSGVRLLAPGEDGWRQVTGRPDAELGVEYPLPWERNGEVTALLMDLGFLAGGGERSAV